MRRSNSSNNKYTSKNRQRKTRRDFLKQKVERSLRNARDEFVYPLWEDFVTGEATEPNNERSEMLLDFFILYYLACVCAQRL